MMLPCSRTRCMLLPVLLTLLVACGDPSGPPDTSPPSPSILTGCFSGDSAKSSEVFAPVISLAVPKGSCQATLLWTRCPDGDFLRYDLFRSNLPGIESAPWEAEIVDNFAGRLDTVFTDTDPVWGEICFYALRTVDTSELVAWSNEVRIDMPGELPEASFLAGWDTGGAITLRWTQCEDYDLESYRLYRSDSPCIPADTSSAMLLLHTEDRFDTLFIDSLVLAEGEYYYALLTENTKGFHKWSNEACVFFYELQPYPYRVMFQFPLDQYAMDMAVTVQGDRGFCTHTNLSADEINMESFSMGELDGSPFARYVCPSQVEDLVYFTPAFGDYLIEMDSGPGGGQRTCQLSGTPGKFCTGLDGGTIYVPFLDDHIIWIIDAASFSVTDMVVTDSRTRSLVYNQASTEIYALSYLDDVLTILSVSSPEVVAEVPLGDLPVHMALTPDGEDLYISCLGDDEILRISCSERRVLEAIEIDRPSDLAVHPSGDYLYAIQSENTIGIYTIPGHELIRTINIMGSINLLDAHPSGDYMLVTTGWALYILVR